MRTISRDVQNTFEELAKLLLRKSLRPILNPLNQNTKIVYNKFRGRYERGFIGSSCDDNINKYTYTMTHESLGWTNDILANFKIMAKFMKNNVAQRFPAGNTKTHNNIKSKNQIAFSDKEGKKSGSMSQYKNFLNYLNSRNMQKIISNKLAYFIYTADIPYAHSFKQLESVGKDIINQTDPSISGEDSAKMSTSMLRVKLYNLEQNLANLSVDHPSIFDAFVEMIRIINSVNRIKMVWVINLIAALSYQRFDDLPESQQEMYTDALGEEFICAFNSNELIIILLQSDAAELILTSSYLYPLLKMLFIVFGYSKLVPNVTDKCSDQMCDINKDRLKKHFDKYRGASFRRGDTNNINSEDDISNDNYSEEDAPTPCSKPYVKLPADGVCANVYVEDPYKPDQEPYDLCIYEYIKLFGDLYPTIIGLVGGTENFPPESIEIGCNDIPPTYECLASIPEYLWRFNDYSYCRYLEYVNSKQMINAINSKINAKAKYLQSI
jgi:hypothetical protein